MDQKNLPLFYQGSPHIKIAIAELGLRYKFADQKAAAQNIAGQTPRSEKAHCSANIQ
jgi:hypothetical protein